MTLNKERIRKRFHRAAETYDDQAVIQFKVADRLLTLLRQHEAIPPRRVLEIGCCTGLLTSRLVNLYRGLEKLYVNDMVPEFESKVIDRVSGYVDLNFLSGDIENIPLPGNLDLVISSSTFHWLDDLPVLFDRLAEKMTPESTLAFSMYSNKNLQEFREITGIGLHYYGFEELTGMVAKHFQVLAREEELITFKFNDPLDILHHLRETGVNAVREEQWDRSDINDFIARYRDRFGEGELVRLTYHPFYCIARKTQ